MVKYTKKVKLEIIKLKKQRDSKRDNLQKLLCPKDKYTKIRIQKFLYKNKKAKTINEMFPKNRIAKWLLRKLARRYKRSSISLNKYAMWGHLLRKTNYWISKKVRKSAVTVFRLTPYKKSKFVKIKSDYAARMKVWANIKPKKAKIIRNLMTKDGIIRPAAYVLPTLVSRFFRRTAIVRRAKKIHLKLKKTNKIKYKKLKILRKRLLSKRLPQSYEAETKYKKAYTKSTIKQRWLVNRYLWFKYKKQKKSGFGIDFIKTQFGLQLLLAHKEHLYILFRKRLSERNKVEYIHVTRTRSNIRAWARKMQSVQKRAWFYNQQVYSKKLPHYFQKNTVTNIYPYNKFANSWRRDHRYPWLEYLISRRLLYSGFLTRNRAELRRTQRFCWIPFLRNKISIAYKKNKLYNWYKRELYDWDHRHVIRRKKKARIKQILFKTILPFYGHIRPKQFASLKRKARVKKSTLLSRDEFQLGYLELRLDVIVYRLNLAPTIFWARRLIQDGCIFISSLGRNELVEKQFQSMYAHYKFNAFPLILRDPQLLYKNSTWNVSNRISVSRDKLANSRLLGAKRKFFLEPVRNINYLTNPGDVILCSPSALHNMYKSNKIFWQKPIPTHLLAYSPIFSSQNYLKPRRNSLNVLSPRSKFVPNVGVVLFPPSFSDLHESDRIKHSFFRAISL